MTFFLTFCFRKFRQLLTALCLFYAIASVTAWPRPSFGEQEPGDRDSYPGRLQQDSGGMGDDDITRLQQESMGYLQQDEDDSLLQERGYGVPSKQQQDSDEPNYGGMQGYGYFPEMQQDEDDSDNFAGLQQEEGYGVPSNQQQDSDEPDFGGMQRYNDNGYFPELQQDSDDSDYGELQQDGGYGFLS